MRLGIAPKGRSYTGLSLKFPGLSEIRSDLPHFQADFETSQHARDIMSLGGAVVLHGSVGRQMRKTLVLQAFAESQISRKI